jgi:hypothetical protein
MLTKKRESKKKCAVVPEYIREKLTQQRGLRLFREPKKLFTILGWFGEFQFCNRPVWETSFLTLSTAESLSGITGTGRIDWNCEWGIITSGCEIKGGMISITKDFAVKKGEKAVKVELKGNGKVETDFFDYEGKVGIILGMYKNDYDGLDFLIGITGRIAVKVRGFLSAAVEVYGALKIITSPNRETKIGGEFKFTVAIEVAFMKFEVGVWITYDPDIICANTPSCFKGDADGEGGWTVRFTVSFQGDIIQRHWNIFRMASGMD